MWEIHNLKALEKDKEAKPATAKSNPDAEVKRLLFKDQSANILVTYKGLTRRRYSNGELVEDIVGYTGPLKSIEDFADALAFVNYVGNTTTHTPTLKGSTKRQRERTLKRQTTKAIKESDLAPIEELV